jgi:hypothetical protein
LTDFFFGTSGWLATFTGTAGATTWLDWVWADEF